MSRDRAVAACDKYMSQPWIIDTALYAMLDYIIELEDRLAILEQRPESPDYFRPLGGR